jgi:hypothetical protein
MINGKTNILTAKAEKIKKLNQESPLENFIYINKDVVFLIKG